MSKLVTLPLKGAAAATGIAFICWVGYSMLGAIGWVIYKLQWSEARWQAAGQTLSWNEGLALAILVIGGLYVLGAMTEDNY